MEDGIIYLCQDCLKSLDITGLFRAINEVGRKSCTECGGNGDNLDVVGKSIYERKFIECPGCSEAGGADMPVKHLPPVC